MQYAPAEQASPALAEPKAERNQPFDPTKVRCHETPRRLPVCRSRPLAFVKRAAKIEDAIDMASIALEHRSDLSPQLARICSISG